MTLPVSSHGLTAAKGSPRCRRCLKAHVQARRRQRDDDGLRPRRRRRERHDRDGRALARRDPGSGAVAVAAPPACRAAPAPPGATSASTVMLGVNDVARRAASPPRTPGRWPKFVEPSRDPARLRLVAEPRLAVRRRVRQDRRSSPTPAAASCRSRSQFTHIFGDLRGTKTASGDRRLAAHRSRPSDDARPTTRRRAPTRSGARPPPTAPATRSSGRAQIYQASWWNQGTPPGTGGADSPSGPWQPIGPVPPGQPRAEAVELLVTGTYTPLVAERASTTKATGSASTGCPTRPAGTRRANSRSPNCPPTRAPPWEPLFKYPGEPTAVSTGAETH